jgi:lipopolysaccharide/colanic/teichoic acid biosynthesis glycosyltransferase
MRGFDLAFSIALFPALFLCAIGLLILNPFFNPGPLFFPQRRMGRECEAFWLVKLRTMRVDPIQTRGADDPLELDRITPLGKLLRKSRMDELPQIVNVLAGRMSMIGPRPDSFEHAVEYLHSMPNYRDRYHVRPGITGLAQVRLGYVEGTASTAETARFDIEYVANASVCLDAVIAIRTFAVVFRLSGR